MVVQHGLNVLEPLQLRRSLVVVENTSVEHQAGHHQGTDGQSHELGFAGDAPSTPDVEQA